MAQIGAFTFVLHSHLPYARQAGMWPHGEEWIHEAIAETYVPLLDALNDLAEEGLPFQVDDRDHSDSRRATCRSVDRRSFHSLRRGTSGMGGERRSAIRENWRYCAT